MLCSAGGGNGMTEALFLHNDHFLPLLRKLSKSFRLVGPVLNDQGDTLYSDITDFDQAAIDLHNQPQNSLKQFFFPQEDVLASYIVDQDEVKGRGAHSFFSLLPESQPTLFFGVRSCDLFAILYMDLIFLGGKYRDVYYEQRRKGAIFIGLGCNHPFENCFCNATRNGPFLEFGFDLQLTDIAPDEKGFYVEVGKAGGRKIIQEHAPFFSSADEKYARLQYQRVLESRGLFQQLVHVDLATRLLQENQDTRQIIAELSIRCQDCGGCAYVCPTCTCFTISDRQGDTDSGERVRSWDACTFAGFSLMAGDHNPVSVKQERLKRRFYHKLHADVQRHGRSSCVGCGRCVGICFGGVDIITFINRLTSLADNDLPEQQE
jgi:ferredoxin